MCIVERGDGQQEERKDHRRIDGTPQVRPLPDDECHHDRSLRRSRPAADRSRYSQPTSRQPGTARQPRCSTPSCAVGYRRLRFRWFVERTCGDSRQDRRHACGRKTPRHTDWPTLSRLRIPAHWLVLRSTVEGIPASHTSVQCGFGLLNMWRSFCEEPLAMMMDKREFLPSVIGSGARPSNRGRSCLADHAFGAIRTPAARARGADEPDWCDARSFARRHRSVSGGIVRETRRSKPCRRDQGCVSARLAGAVGAARTPLGHACH